MKGEEITFSCSDEIRNIVHKYDAVKKSEMDLNVVDDL